jgi:hypothetical protein
MKNRPAKPGGLVLARRDPGSGSALDVTDLKQTSGQADRRTINYVTNPVLRRVIVSQMSIRAEPKTGRLVREAVHEASNKNGVGGG